MLMICSDWTKLTVMHVGIRAPLCSLPGVIVYNNKVCGPCETVKW